MKPHFHKVPSSGASSFSLRHDTRSNFGTLWHFHPELELHFILKGHGIQYIGDTVSGFSDGDLIFLGQNLPHTWRCSEEYFGGHPSLKVEAFVLQFLPSCLGKEFLTLPETQSIPALFEVAKRGLKITGKTKELIAGMLYKMEDASQLERIIYLLQILNTLADSQEMETISPGYTYSHLLNTAEMQRLEKIYTYVLANFREDISLERISSISNLTVSSFCRYFKTMTNKTFFEFLIEVRISNVCKGLIEDKLPIEMIGYECGFHNISNFYRHFKKVTGLTPNQYKKRYIVDLRKIPE